MGIDGSTFNGPLRGVSIKRVRGELAFRGVAVLSVYADKHGAWHASFRRVCMSCGGPDCQGGGTMTTYAPTKLETMLVALGLTLSPVNTFEGRAKFSVN